MDHQSHPAAKTTADYSPGQLVRYVPYHADGDSSHPDCATGRVSSTNDRFVFVRFGHSANSEACNPNQLQ